MVEIWNIFGDQVRAVLPLFETEVKGAHMLNRTVDRLFSPA
jgi:arsenite/tail-anchored protein-transporting ATPase